MGGVVVEDDVNLLAGRDRCLDVIEEPDELLMAMALHARPSTLPSRTAKRVVVPWRL